MRQIEVVVQDLEYSMYGLPGRPKLQTETLCGIAINESKTLLHRNLTPVMTTKNREITLPSEQAEVLATFFEQFFCRPPDSTPYDCHGFTSFLQGWDRDIATPEQLTRRGRGYILSTSEKIGQISTAYATASQDRAIHHSMTSLGGSEYLSVLGTGTDSPLVISDGNATMNAYGSAMIREIAEYIDLDSF
jgi:hypothetical protein